MDNDLMTIEEAREYMRIKAYTLDELIRTGKLPIYRINRKSRFIHKKDADEYLKSCRVVRKAGGK